MPPLRPESTLGRLAARVRPGRSLQDETGAKVLVLIPARNAEMLIWDTLDAVTRQTRVPHRIVVIADNCTDRTEEIARTFKGVTVMRTVENLGERAGALDQGWKSWQRDADYVAVVDAGTVPGLSCLQQMEAELSSSEQPGSVTTTDRGSYTLGEAAELMRIQMRRNKRDAWSSVARRRKPSVVKGQVTLLSNEALATIAAKRSADGGGPFTVADSAQRRRRDTAVPVAAQPSQNFLRNLLVRTSAVSAVLTAAMYLLVQSLTDSPSAALTAAVLTFGTTFLGQGELALRRAERAGPAHEHGHRLRP